MKKKDSVAVVPKLHAYLKRTLSMMEKSCKNIEAMIGKLEDVELSGDGTRGQELSALQAQIMGLMKSGVIRRSEICRELGLNPRTYDTHLIRIRKKLGFLSNRELINYVVSIKT